MKYDYPTVTDVTLTVCGRRMGRTVAAAEEHATTVGCGHVLSVVVSGDDTVGWRVLLDASSEAPAVDELQARADEISKADCAQDANRAAGSGL